MNTARPENEATFSPDDFPPRLGPSLLLVAGAALVGALTGLLGVAFLRLLTLGTNLRLGLTARLAAEHPVSGWAILSLAVAASAAVAAWLVRRFAPNAGGSGIPYVERILRGHGIPHHAGVLPVKFFGGLLALSSGLFLGREGPLVQMGAVIGEKVGRQIPGVSAAWKSLMTAGAGAGLATAFNAPVGGTIFILEEVLRRVTPLSFILGATAATASAVIQRAVFHSGQDFHVVPIEDPPAASVLIFLAFGIFTGFVGVAYNRTLLFLRAVNAEISLLPAPLRAAAIGFLVGTVAWLRPEWVGGGDAITQSLLAGGSTLIAGLIAIRFLLGPLSYAAGTPGGLFAPIITLGALFGIGIGHWQSALWPTAQVSPTALAVAGMAGLFTATIRAPITGIVICLEMTGCYSLLFPLLATSLGAYLIPTLLKDTPIYDALAAQPPGGLNPVARSSPSPRSR